jgi:anti-sigma factor RsiW
MDRYQFEDTISAYLENELSLSERQSFESYMNANPDAMNLVESIKITMRLVKNLSDVKASDKFMTNLYSRIEFEKNRPSKKIVARQSKTLFGFTPFYASLMTILVVSFITVSFNLWENDGNPINPAPTFTRNLTDSLNPTSAQPNGQFNHDAVLAATEVDSADTTLNKKKKNNLNDKVQFVNDQR